ncbi:MAG TPA: serine racemase VanT catalytic subunit [Ruminiclostridium sp.]
MNGKDEYAGLDYFRMIAALLIVAIHTFPLVSASQDADFILTHIFARIAVPFFFMTTGFFLLPKYMEDVSLRKNVVIGFFKKTCILYGVAILLYLPINIYTGYFNKKPFLPGFIKDIIFNGTFYHLWYLPASILGVGIVFFLINIFKEKVLLCIAIILYIIGLFGDSYYGIANQISFLKSFYDVLFLMFDYTRNGLLLAPVFIIMGGLIAKSKHEYTIKSCLTGFVISTALLITEGIVLKSFSVERHDSMYLMLIPCMFFLFQLLLLWKGKSRKVLRTLSLLVYIIHPFCIILVRGFAKVTGLKVVLIDNSIIHYIAVVIVSLVVSSLLLIIISKKDKKLFGDRAWAEINLDNLNYNVNQFRKILPKSCNLMAVVKANAYGHGDTKIAKELNQLGIDAFAVATMEEGIQLRRKGISGEILIFGYTHPGEIYRLTQYDLTQTVVDYDYAKILNNFGKRIKVHVKIDTGMHRLGENYNEIQNIDRIFQCENLVINGTYTHLSVADSLKEEDVEFSNQQIEKFYNTVEQLKASGYDPKKIHIQSSYGVLNYPYLHCDYARVGIALYGVLSNENDKTRVFADLQPVLSLKARVVLTKEIAQTESVGYGRQFTAQQNTKIAVISIGYADGVPRSLSCGKGQVIINGKKALIIGKICMDQLMVDITDIPNVKQGDIATLIGQDGAECISAEAVAAQSGTLTNELLSRLGVRILRIYVNNCNTITKNRFEADFKNIFTTFKFSIKSTQLFSRLSE